MNISSNLSLVLLVFKTFATDDVNATKKHLDKAKGIAEAKTYTINYEFCLSCLTEEEKEGRDTLEEVHAYALLEKDPTGNLPPSFTICSSSMTTYGSYQIMFSLLGKDGNSWLGTFLKVADKTSSFYHGKWSEVKLPPVFAHQWVRSCLSFDSELGRFQWVVDGILVENDTIAGFENKPTNLTGMIVLGAWQDGASKKWKSWTSNQVTNLNIFSTALTVEKMQQNTKMGECSEKGDYLSWGEMQWNLKEPARIEITDEKDVCTKHPSINFYPADFPTMESCRHFCGYFGSRSPPLVNQQQWTGLQKDLEGLRRPKKIWLAIDDRDAEGAWVDYYNGESVNFSLPWAPGEPDGGTSENCAVLLSSVGKIKDYPCDKPFAHACLCQRNPLPQLRLRGLCSNSHIKDTLFQPVNNMSDFEKLTLLGLRTSVNFDHVEESWVLTDKESNVTGRTYAPYKSLTLGRHNWTIGGDKGCKREGGEFTLELKMSGCRDGDFTCDDGQCVNMRQRCDQSSHCRDKSDEKNCNILHLEESYNMNIPPTKLQSEGANVTVSIDILKLVDIKEEDYSIETQFQITLTWNENRAVYHNLKHEKTLNALTRKDIMRLWLPEVIYENTDQKDTTRLGEPWEWATQVVIDRKGNFTLSGFDIVDETQVFKGSENNLIMSQTYTREFQCSYDFVRYPFDTQVMPLNHNSVIFSHGYVDKVYQ